MPGMKEDVMPTLYRVENPFTQAGLWYNADGEFTEFVKSINYRNADLPMKWEEHMAGGWFSSVDNVEDLKTWFTLDDMEILEAQGYGIYEFDVEDYRTAFSESGIEHTVFRREKVVGPYRQLSKAVLL